MTGCTSDNAGITSISGTVKGTLTNDTNGFTSLLGPSNAHGTLIITWKSVPALTVKTTTITVSAGQTIGNVNAPFGDSASYGQFTISGDGGHRFLPRERQRRLVRHERSDR